MTGQRLPRQMVSRPATMMATAPANSATRQGTPSSIVWTEPPVTTAPAEEPEEAPPVVEPEPPEATEAVELVLEEAAAMMRAALARMRGAGAIAHANYTGAASTNLGMWS